MEEEIENIHIHCKDETKDQINKKIRRKLSELSPNISKYGLLIQNYNHDDLGGIIFPEGPKNMIIFTCIHSMKGKMKTFEGLILPTSLEILRFRICYIKSFIGLTLPPNLEKFNCSDNEIESFNGLTLPESLTHFDCSGNSIYDFEGLRLNENLKIFDFENNPINDFSDLKLNSKLEVLYIGYDVIEDTPIKDIIFPSSLKIIINHQSTDVKYVNPIFNSVLENTIPRVNFDVALYNREQLIFLYLNINIKSYLSYDEILTSLLT
jgi:Leucine-rich repeat (LRR) protein